MTTVSAFWAVDPDHEGFDPVRFPEIKPYIAAAHDDDDDELGLRRLLEWPEVLLSRRTRRGRRRVRRAMR